MKLDEPCEFDTNGDGDCGRKTCPRCYPENMPLGRIGDNRHRVTRAFVEVVLSYGITHRFWLDSNPENEVDYAFKIDADTVEVRIGGPLTKAEQIGS